MMTSRLAAAIGMLKIGIPFALASSFPLKAMVTSYAPTS